MTRGVRMENRTCYVEDCGRVVMGRGLCNKHWKRLYMHGDTGAVFTVRNKELKCRVEHCDKDAFSKGLCSSHYKTIFKYGRNYLTMRPQGTGTITKDGYKELNINGERILEHVLLAEKALGKKLPAGAVVHHMNEDKLDNFTPFNLIICPNQAYHMLLHKRMNELKRSAPPACSAASLEELGL